MIRSLQRFSKDEVAQERLRILEFYQEFGEKATKKAFAVDRKTVWVWQKRFKTHNHHLSSLCPYSTTPHHPREMQTDTRIVSFIRLLREQYPRLGKEKIKPLLDRYCLREGIVTIQTATIGKVIKRHKLFFQKSGRIYHNPASAWGTRKRTKRMRITKAPRPENFGYVEMDTITLFIDTMKVYIYSAIDVHGKFSFSLPYQHLNSANTVDFFTKIQTVYPYPITRIQTDNGLEFLGDFEAYLKRIGISHVFIYPRCCRVNGVVERYQRSLQEEFVMNNLQHIHDPRLFTTKLIEYLIFYNTQRVHQSLNLTSPMDYLISKGGMSNMSVASTTLCFFSHNQL